VSAYKTPRTADRKTPEWRAYYRNYYRTHPKFRQYLRDYYKANREKVNAYMREWRESHPRKPGQIAIERRQFEDVLLAKVDAIKDEIFWAWLAGFWEGEGSLYPHAYLKDGRSTGMRLTITQSDRRPLDHIESKLGGRVYPQKYRPIDKRGVKCNAPVYKWDVYRIALIRKIVSHFRPYLVFRGSAVDKALSDNAHIQRKVTHRDENRLKNRIVIKN
jgi:hypothetical protein